MRNIKIISIFAACGFVLSFVFGLFSHSSFLIILLRAVISSVVFVILGILISLIFNKFLIDSNSFGFESDDAEYSQQGGSPDKQKPGQIIDVVVEDEELPVSESDNHFVVGSNTQMLKKTDVGDINQSSGDMNSSRNSGFVPMKGFENISSSPDNSMDINVTAAKQKNNTDSSTESISDEDLDTLPDMEGLSLSEEDNSSDETETYTDSEFVSSANMYKKSGGTGPDIKDAALIARAISTALSEEN